MVVRSAEIIKNIILTLQRRTTARDTGSDVAEFLYQI